MSTLMCKRGSRYRWREPLGPLSIQEQAGHLLDLESLGMGCLDDHEKGRKTLSAADMENRKTHEANPTRTPSRISSQVFAKREQSSPDD
jgi:hypothetical protein